MADIPIFVLEIYPFHALTTKLNGIAHEYASVDKHPNVSTVVGKKIPFLKGHPTPILQA
ncbi:hypothetical protein ACFLV3_04895 [Chloroflexota bacterium]